MTTRSGGGTETTTCCWMAPNGTRNSRDRSCMRVSVATSSRALSCDVRDRMGYEWKCTKCDGTRDA